MTKRKNITMSDEIAKWYEDKSEELGVPQSSLMTIALKQYIDQEKAINMIDKMSQTLKELEQLKEINKED